MNRVWLIALLGATSFGAGADECIVDDDFASWTNLWGLAANQTTAMQMAYGDARVQAYSPYGCFNASTPSLAGAMSVGWQMDMTQDWAIQADLHIDPPVPTSGDLRMSIFVMLEGNPATMYMQRAWSFGGGTYYIHPTGGYLYRKTTRWINNTPNYDLFSYNRPVDDTWYIWWDSSTGVMYGSDTLGNPSGAFATNLNGFSASSAAWVGFGGYAMGSIVPAFNGSMWGDDLCVWYGNTVGSVVGACCMGDECVQVPIAGCNGTFLGYGVPCEGCTCDGPPTCPGDVNEDLIVSTTDLSFVIKFWGTDICTYDIDGSGTVGMLDLLTLLRNWGSCGG